MGRDIVTRLRQRLEFSTLQRVGIAWQALALLAVALVTTSCTSADGPQASFDSNINAAKIVVTPVDEHAVKATIEFMTWSSPVETALLRTTVRDFQREYPNIHVLFHPYAGDYQSAVLTRFAGGQAPDVLAVDNKVAPDWIAKGLLRPLDGYVSGNQFELDKFYPQLLSGFRDPNRHLYGIPKDYSTLVLFTNTKMLRAAGIQQAPRNWKELKSAAKKLTNKSHHGLCIAPSWERLTAFALQNGGGLVSDDWARMNVFTKETQAAVRYYLSFLKDGSGATAEKMGAAWCGDAFGKKMVAMAVEGNWLMPVLSHSYPDVNFTMSELPMGKVRANLAYSPGYSVSRTTKSPDAAWVLVSYLTGREGMQKWTEQGLALPARRDVPVAPGREPIAAGLSYATVWQLPPGFYNRVLMTAENELTATIQGDQTIDGMLKRIDTVGKAMITPAGGGGGQ